MNEDITMQVFPRALYVVTSGDTETIIKDGKSGKQIGKLPPNSQGIIFALSNTIKVDNAVTLNLLK